MENSTYQRLLPIMLLTCSNLFMTIAWYGHLKFKEKPIWLVIFASWGIAFFEYCLQVPANRWGNAVFSHRTKNYSGNNHAGGILGFRDALPGREDTVELCSGFRVCSGGGDVHVFAEELIFSWSAARSLLN